MHSMGDPVSVIKGVGGLVLSCPPWGPETAVRLSCLTNLRSCLQDACAFQVALLLGPSDRCSTEKSVLCMGPDCFSVSFILFYGAWGMIQTWSITGPVFCLPPAAGCYRSDLCHCKLPWFLQRLLYGALLSPRPSISLHNVPI